MYRYTYMGYTDGEVKVKKTEDVYYSVVGCFDGKAFVYVETPIKDFDVESVAEGKFIPFPDGKGLFRMEQIFYCDDFKDDGILCIPVEERNPIMSLMIMGHDDPYLAYVGHHYVLQETGNTVWNRYYSIYTFGNILLSVSDRQEIPAPRRENIFDVDTKSIIGISREVMVNGVLPWKDGAPRTWRIINK